MMEEVNLKEKTICVYDERLCVSLAQRLARDYGRVLYFSEWACAFPYKKDSLVGYGIEGIERIKYFWPYLDEIDVFCFPFIYRPDLQEYLRSIGKQVWGSGWGQEIELDRADTNGDLPKFGLPQPFITVVNGVDNLREHLSSVKNKYIKVSQWRGDNETWKHEDIKTSTSKLDELSVELGPEKDDFEFIIEDKIDGEEWGYDGFSVNGEFPKTTLFGIEIKDLGYCAHVKKHKDISPLITDYLDAIAPTLKANDYANFFHSENRITPKKVSFPIDITCRIGLPPGELYMEMCSNLPEIIWYGSIGKLKEPEFEAKYGIQVNIYSSRSDDKWNEIRFPKEIDRWVKLRSCMKKNDTWYIVPGIEQLFEIGAVVAIGNTMDECIEKVKEYAKQIKGHLIDKKIGSIEDMKGCIENGKKIGINFD